MVKQPSEAVGQPTRKALGAPGLNPREQSPSSLETMYQPLLTLVAPLLHPSNRLRMQCLLLLSTLVVTLLYLGSRPGIAVIFPYLPWDKLVHATAYAGFATLAWVGLGSRSLIGPVLVTGGIGVLDEWMQYYSPGRSSDVRDLVADLVGATIIVLALRWLQAAELRQRIVKSSV